MSKLLDT